MTQQCPSLGQGVELVWEHALNWNPTDRGPRFGIRAHDIGRFSADELARRVSEAGLDCVQLALAKAICGFEPRPGALGGRTASAIAGDFRRHKVGIEVLGCYVNPIHPDRAARAAGIAWFKEHLRHARDFGCRLVALESGSLHVDQRPHHPENESPEAFAELTEVLADLAEEAGRHGVVVGIEPVHGHVLSTPEKTRLLLDRIASPHLRVVFDPVNLLSPANAMEAADVTNRALECFGGWISVVHLKDFRVRPQGLATCAAGEGIHDPGPLLAWLSTRHPGMAVLLEEAGADQVSSCLAGLQRHLTHPIS